MRPGRAAIRLQRPCRPICRAGALSPDDQLHPLGPHGAPSGRRDHGVHGRGGDEGREVGGRDLVGERWVGCGDCAEVMVIAVYAPERRSGDFDLDGCGKSALGVHREREPDGIARPGGGGRRSDADRERAGRNLHRGARRDRGSRGSGRGRSRRGCARVREEGVGGGEQGHQDADDDRNQQGRVFSCHVGMLAERLPVYLCVAALETAERGKMGGFLVDGDHDLGRLDHGVDLLADGKPEILHGLLRDD